MTLYEFESNKHPMLHAFRLIAENIHGPFYGRCTADWDVEVWEPIEQALGRLTGSEFVAMATDQDSARNQLWNRPEFAAWAKEWD
jgi:hypothetical protein